MICTPPIPIPILIYETPLGHPFASPFPTDSSSWSLSSDRFSKRLDTCTTLRRSRDQRRSLLFRGTFSWLDGKLLCCENFGSLYRKQHECLNRARFLEYFKNNWGLRGIGWFLVYDMQKKMWVWAALSNLDNYIARGTVKQQACPAMTTKSQKLHQWCGKYPRVTEAIKFLFRRETIIAMQRNTTLKK